MGATDVVNVGGGGGGDAEADVVKRVRSLTEGNNGAHLSFEVVGNPVTFRQAVMSLRDGGRAVMTGIAKLTDVGELPITHLVRRKIEIRGSYGAKARVDTPAILKLLERGEVGLESISERFPLDGAREAYERLWAGKIVGKAVVEF